MSNKAFLVETRGNNLEDLLEQRLLSKSALSRAANVSLEVVNRILRGQRVRTNKFLAVCRALAIRPWELLPSWDREKRGGA